MSLIRWAVRMAYDDLDRPGLPSIPEVGVFTFTLVMLVAFLWVAATTPVPA